VNVLRDQIKRLEDEFEDRNRSMQGQIGEFEFKSRRKKRRRLQSDDVNSTPERTATVVSDSIIAPKPFTGKTT
jgi:hypothetical protein